MQTNVIKQFFNEFNGTESKFFLCIFRNVLIMITGARGWSNIKGRELKLFLVTPETQYNGKKKSANLESNFLDF